jgi:tRNA-2-methylthio-N6-dimethylallyladenosine synthase
MAPVLETVKAERLAQLQALLANQQRDFNRSRMGMQFDVLFEKSGRRKGQIVGRSPWLQPVQVMAPTELIGDIDRVTVDGLGTNSLFASLDEVARSRTVGEASV